MQSATFFVFLKFVKLTCHIILQFAIETTCMKFSAIYVCCIFKLNLKKLFFELILTGRSAWPLCKNMISEFCMLNFA